MREQHWDSDEDSDWILLDVTEFDEQEQGEPKLVSDHEKASAKPDKGNNLRDSEAGGSSLLIFASAKARQRHRQEQGEQRQMALDANDIGLIRASWIPARKDPTGSGVLLFKSLFTKFPDYLKFFTQFTDLDVENLHENKRLLKHAVKVIETVTFVVDSIGDANKADQLNEALTNLVRGHLKRRIGLNEFRNLGIVIIDFICDLQQRRGSPPRSSTYSPSEHASLESMASPQSDNLDEPREGCQNYNHHHNQQGNNTGNAANQQAYCNNNLSYSPSSSPTNVTNLDTSLLVTAWTKLYGSILDLVRRESVDVDQ